MSRHSFRILSLLLLAGLLSSCKRAPREEPPNLVMIESNDADMRAAIARARAALPEFWQTFAHPTRGEDRFAVKVEMQNGTRKDFIWVSDLERKDGKIFGTADENPDFAKSNQRVEVPEAEIADWLYRRDGKMVGNYTLRVLFKRMPPEQVQSYKELLADP